MRRQLRLGVDNVRWIAGRAEDVKADRFFELVAIGNAFHRLQRRVIAESATHWLVPGGHLAVLWSSSPWDGSQEWQHVMADTVHRWTQLAGATERIPANVDEHLAAEHHRTVLARAGFTVVGEFEFTTPHEWTVETPDGVHVRDLDSVATGARAERSGVRARPARTPARGGAPGGVFPEEVSFSYTLARGSSEDVQCCQSSGGAASICRVRFSSTPSSSGATSWRRRPRRGDPEDGS